MLLHKNTIVYVTSPDGTSQSTLGGLCLSLAGGTLWDDIEVVTDVTESKQLERKRRAIERMARVMRYMTAEGAELAVVALEHNISGMPKESS